MTPEEESIAFENQVKNTINTVLKKDNKFAEHKKITEEAAHHLKEFYPEQTSAVYYGAFIHGFYHGWKAKGNKIISQQTDLPDPPSPDSTPSVSHPQQTTPPQTQDPDF